VKASRADGRMRQAIAHPQENEDRGRRDQRGRSGRERRRQLEAPIPAAGTARRRPGKSAASARRRGLCKAPYAPSNRSKTREWRPKPARRPEMQFLSLWIMVLATRSKAQTQAQRVPRGPKGAHSVRFVVASAQQG